MSKGRFHLDDARCLAWKICAELAPGCDRIEVAGSIRRCEPEVGDIEILCQPKAAPGSGALFAGDTSGWAIDPIIERLIDQGRLERLNNGTKHRKLRAVKTGAQIDLFVVTDPSTWGVQLAIRTGPAPLSKRFVTPQIAGGLLPDHCEIRDGWQLFADGARVETHDEVDFLHLCDAMHLEDPRRRSSEGFIGHFPMLKKDGP